VAQCTQSCSNGLVQYSNALLRFVQARSKHATAMRTRRRFTQLIRAKRRPAHLRKEYAAMHVYRDSWSDASEDLQNSDVLLAVSSWIALGGNL